MDKPSHNYLFCAFAAGWALFLIAETAHMAADAKPNCDHFDDGNGDDAMEKRCNGQALGAVFAIIGAVIAAVSIALFQDAVKRLVLFLASIACYFIGLGSYAGGVSDSSCEGDDDSSEKDCQGFGAASAFYIFAAIAALAAVFVAFKMTDARGHLVAVCFVALALVGVAQTAWYGRAADQSCDDVDEDDDKVADSSNALCTGNGFASFFMSLAMVVAAAFAVFVFVKKTPEKSMIAWYIWATLFLLASTCAAGGNAKNYCEIYDDQEYEEKLCQGYSAAAFFYILGAVATGAGIFVSFKGMDKVSSLVFYLSFALYYLGYCGMSGGVSASGCQLQDDIKNPPDYVEDLFEAQCGGYAGASLFSAFAFVALLAAAILTQTSVVERADEGEAAGNDGTAAEAKPVENDAPQVVPAQAEETSGADV